MTGNAFERSVAARARIRSGDRDGGRGEVQAILAPGDAGPGTLNECALALAEGNFLGEACACVERALALSPDDARLWVNKGSILEQAGRPVSAIDAYRRALALDEKLVGAVNNLAGAYKNLGLHVDMLTMYRRACALAPGNARAHSNLLLAMHYTRDTPVLAVRDEHLRWARRFADPLNTDTAAHPNPARPSRRLRVGYVSADFRHHPVAYFAGSLLAAHDRTRVEVFCYDATRIRDPLTARLRGLADHWREIENLDDDEAARRIRGDAIDVLVDLGGHTLGNRLLVLARRPAPVQGTYLGYPDTTGMRAVDFRITDAVADPPVLSDGLSSERVARLDDVFLCYRAPSNAPPVSPLPATHSPFTFGSFNNSAKLSDETIALWARVLEAVAGSRLLIKAHALAEEEALDALAGRFAAAGVLRDRLLLRGPERMVSDHLATYAQVDVALDPVPYDGTTTTCEALWMGVPVITLRGERHVSRVGVSLLHAVGLDDCIARSEEEYVAFARTVAADLPRLAQRREALRARVAASPLCDAPRLARSIERVYRREWRAWCAGREAPPPRLLRALSRTGATLICRCLGAMRGVMLLSEIHPQGSAMAARVNKAWSVMFSPLDQARRWYGLEPHPGVLEGLERGDDVLFATMMHGLSRAAAQRKSALVVRDWSHLDFFGVPYRDRPPLCSALDTELARSPDARRVTVFRHPAAQWASLSRLPIMRGRLPPAEFLDGVRAFAASSADSPLVRYEEYTRAPARELRRICEALKLDYDPQWESRWMDNERVTGDSRRTPRILPVRADEQFAAAQGELRTLEGYEALCESMGYHPRHL